MCWNIHGTFSIKLSLLLTQRYVNSYLFSFTFPKTFWLTLDAWRKLFKIFWGSWKSLQAWKYCQQWETYLTELELGGCLVNGDIMKSSETLSQKDSLAMEEAVQCWEWHPDIDLVPSHTVLHWFVILLRHIFLLCLRVLTYKIETLNLLQVIITVTFYFIVLSFFKALMEKHFCLSNNTLNNSKNICSLSFCFNICSFYVMYV